MKRLLSLFIILSLLFSLAACGLHNPNATPDGNDSSPPPTADNSPADPNNVATPDNTLTPPPEDDVTMPPEDSTIPPNDPDQENAEIPDEQPRTVDPYAPMVALTFDDGPHELYSSRILDVLEANKSVATFFEVGYNARLYPEILVRMAELGCEIASHSNSHIDLTKLSRDAMLTDLYNLDQIVYEATGLTPTLVRPPYGAVNSTVKNESGRAMILWTVDPQDWLYRDAQTLIDYLQNYGDLDGEIVLMHSIHGSTAEAMETLVPWLIEQGYQLVTVSELMAYYYGELPEANQFYNQTWFARHERTEFPLELPDEPMKTEIPAFNIVPVVPTPSPSDTPDSSDTPEDPEQPPEDTPPTEEDPGAVETPPEDIEDPVIPPDDPTLPPQDEDPIPDGSENAPDGDSPPEGSETIPPEDSTDEEVPPPESSNDTPPESDGSSHPDGDSPPAN